MDKKRVTLLLGVFALVLIAVCMALVVFDDNEPPVITVESMERTYYAGDGYETVLNGVSASDDKDGSVEVFVEYIIPLTGRNLAKVFYVAIDSEGAVGKASTVVVYFSKSENSDTESLENAEADSDEPMPEDSTEDFQEEPVDGENQAPEETPEYTPEETSAETTGEQDVDPAKPVITLTQEEVVLALGATFNYSNYIESITDDVDAEVDLYRQINVSDTINTNVAGVYEVMYFVTDSDGNTSDTVVLRVTVQAQ